MRLMTQEEEREIENTPPPYVKLGTTLELEGR